MSILQAIILGITQGLTEYAPVSSSGHLILVPWAFGWTIVNDPDLNKTFDVALHMGTLTGALIYFRHDVIRYLRALIEAIRQRAVTTPDQRLALALLVGTIPGVILGAALEGFIKDTLGQPWLIGVMLVVFGVALWWVDLVSASDRGLDTVTPKTGLGLGFAQALALSPGVSRSGITMTAGRWIGLDRETAARFSFLLALPITFGAGLYESLDVVQGGFQGYGPQFFWGFVASGISGFLVIWGLLKYLRTHSFAAFMWYRFGVAAVIFVLIASGVRPATI